ncbi:MAG: hypothetical protein AAFZ15_12030 [Bacteroidota bacterium]
MKIIQKKVTELNHSESEQLKALIYRYFNSASPKFIADRLEKDYGYDIVMIKKGDLIQGVNYYHLIKHKEANWNRPNYIFHFGQAMKRSGYRGNVIWRLGNWYARKNIGATYLLQNITGIASFISPRAFENFTLRFPKCHAELKTDCDINIRNFLTDYFNRIRGISINYNHGFCYDNPELEKEEITEDWNKIYRAKNNAINHLFIKVGIIKMENNRIYKMPRHISVCGIHRPLTFNNRLQLPYCCPKIKHIPLTE